jgi:uncharacterized protein (DUF885 family)
MTISAMTLAIAATLTSSSVSAAPAADVATRVKALNSLLAEQWEYQLKESPEFATILGDYRYNDRFSDFTVAHNTAEGCAGFLQRFEADRHVRFAEQDRLNQQLMVRQLKDGIRSTDLKQFEMPVDSSAACTCCSRNSSRLCPSTAEALPGLPRA